MVLFVPGAPLADTGGGVLGAAKPRRAPVDGVAGQEVDGVCGGGVQRLHEAGDGEVAAGYGLVELGSCDDVRVRSRQPEAAEDGGVELGSLPPARHDEATP